LPSPGVFLRAPSKLAWPSQHGSGIVSIVLNKHVTYTKFRHGRTINEEGEEKSTRALWNAEISQKFYRNFTKFSSFFTGKMQEREKISRSKGGLHGYTRSICQDVRLRSGPTIN
jgi:hypothetical protein